MLNNVGKDGITLHIQKLQGMDELCAAPPEPQDTGQRRVIAWDPMFFNKNPQGSWHDMLALKIASTSITALLCYV